MEFIILVWAITWIIFNLPVPPVGGVGTTRMVVGLVAVVLLVLAFLRMIPHS